MAVEVMNAREFNWVSFSVSLNGMNKGRGMIKELKWKSLSRVWLFATPRNIQCMEFSRPEYCSG